MRYCSLPIIRITDPVEVGFASQLEVSHRFSSELATTAPSASNCRHARLYLCILHPRRTADAADAASVGLGRAGMADAARRLRPRRSGIGPRLRAAVLPSRAGAVGRLVDLYKPTGAVGGGCKAEAGPETARAWT